MPPKQKPRQKTTFPFPPKNKISFQKIVERFVEDTEIFVMQDSDNEVRMDTVNVKFSRVRNEKGTVIGGDITITLEVRKKQS